MLALTALSTWTLLVAASSAVLYVWFRIAFGERLSLAAKLPGPKVYPIIGSLYLLKNTLTVMLFERWSAPRSASLTETVDIAEMQPVRSAVAKLVKSLGVLDCLKNLPATKLELFQCAVKESQKFPQKIGKVEWMHRVGVGLWNPDDVEVILGSSVHLTKSTEYRFFKPWLGNGLLISNGETWRSHRRLIAPTFHQHVLKQFVHLFDRNSRVLCERLDLLVGHIVDIHDHMSETTVEILLETAMGVEKSTQKGGYEYAMAVMKMCEVLHVRMFRPWLWLDSIFNLTPLGRMQKKLLNSIHSLTHEVLAKRKAERKEGIREGLYRRVQEEDTAGDAPDGSEADTTNGYPSGLRDDLDEDVGQKKRIAFLDQLLDVAENGVVLTDKEVEEEVNTIMFEGHDTTAAATSFFLSLMGVHQDIQERCAEEQRRIFGNSQRPATFEDTLEMKYLERCILETLRMFPPVPMLARQATEHIPLKSGYVIPEGSTVVISPYLLHRDPKAFPDPDTFNPDNFLPERCAGRHYYSFIPFSAGPRSCVGRKYAMLKVKILLSRVLRNFHVCSDIKEQDFQLTGDIILKRQEGHQIRLFPRD